MGILVFRPGGGCVSLRSVARVQVFSILVFGAEFGGFSKSTSSEHEQGSFWHADAKQSGAEPRRHESLSPKLRLRHDTMSPTKP